MYIDTEKELAYNLDYNNNYIIQAGAITSGDISKMTLNPGLNYITATAPITRIKKNFRTL